MRSTHLALLAVSLAACGASGHDHAAAPARAAAKLATAGPAAAVAPAQGAAGDLEPMDLAGPSTEFYRREQLPFDEGIEQFSSWLAAGDFTGDGLRDVLAFRYRFNENVRGDVHMFVNSGGTMVSVGGTLIEGPALKFFQPRTFQVRDFNGDGADDIFAGGHGIDSSPDGEPNGLLLSLGNGRMRNASAELPVDVGYTHGSASGDVDGDGDFDIVVNNFGGAAPIENNFLLLNDGDGRFSAAIDRLPAEMLGGGSYSTIGASLLVDCDGDGDVDLVVGDHSEGQVSRWYRNDGTGNFRRGGFVEIPTPRLYGFLAMPVQMKDLDANGDGARDLVISYYSGGANPFHGGTVAVFLNDGAGVFTRIPESALPHSVFQQRDIWVPALETMDWNGDGHDDIVVTSRFLDDYANRWIDWVTPPVWIGRGDGTFHAVPQSILPLEEDDGGRSWYNGQVVDLDGDGGADMFHIGYKWQLLRQVRRYTK